ncbi:hypothetical protein BGAFAR04_K0019 (plasmid) [Borreliella garinii Far04]|nr:hypothetical protein BGAFAR04_K0019 [Borreliella garinii Far04]
MCKEGLLLIKGFKEGIIDSFLLLNLMCRESTKQKNFIE